MLKQSLIALSLTSAFILSGCTEGSNLKEVQEFAEKAEQLSETVGPKEMEQIVDTVGDAAEIVEKTKEVTKSLELLPEEVSEERIVKATIKSCYDGDTCSAVITSTGDLDANSVTSIEKEEKLRFFLVDSSEIKGGPMPFAEEARDRLNQLVKGKEVILELGVGDSRDKYGRLLVYGFLPSGESIQEIMLKEGLLVVRYIYEDTKYLEKYKNAMNIGKSNGVGIWSIPDYAGFDQPYNLDAVK